MYAKYSSTILSTLECILDIRIGKLPSKFVVSLKLDHIFTYLALSYPLKRD